MWVIWALSYETNANLIHWYDVHVSRMFWYGIQLLFKLYLHLHVLTLTCIYTCVCSWMGADTYIYVRHVYMDRYRMSHGCRYIHWCMTCIYREIPYCMTCIYGEIPYIWLLIWKDTVYMTWICGEIPYIYDMHIWRNTIYLTCTYGEIPYIWHAYMEIYCMSHGLHKMAESG